MPLWHSPPRASDGCRARPRRDPAARREPQSPFGRAPHARLSGPQHVNQVGLRGQSDQAILDFAAARGFIIVSKDNDFRQLSFLKGAPPKVIWLEVGNAGTDRIGELLLSRRALVSDFATTAEDALLVLELREDD